MLSFLLTLAAISTTPSPTPTTAPVTASSSEIQKIREVVSQKVMEKLKQITAPATSKLGYVAKIIQVDSASISFETSGNTQNGTFGDDLTVIDLKRNKTKLENLKIGQDVLILGIKDNQANTFEIKRIVFTNPAEIDNQHTVVLGKIVDISRSSPIFSLIPLGNKNTQYQIKTDAKTQILTQEDSTLTSSDLKSGEKIIVILVPDPKMSKTYYAKKIINLSYAPPATPTPKDQ